MNQNSVNFYAQGYAPASTKVGAFSDIGSQLGENSKVQTSVSIPPGWKLGNNVFYGPGCRFANDKYPNLNKDFTAIAGIVEDDVVIGMNASIGAGVTLGKGCIVGMGAVVLKDVPPGETWTGCPAQPKEIHSKFELKTTKIEYNQDDANYLLGLVSGESYFSSSVKGKGRVFTFGMEMNYRDKDQILAVQEFFGCGNIYERRRKTLVNRLNHHTIAVMVRKVGDIQNVIIPFFDTFKLKGHKYIQYRKWREEFLNLYEIGT